MGINRSEQYREGMDTIFEICIDEEITRIHFGRISKGDG